MLTSGMCTAINTGVAIDAATRKVRELAAAIPAGADEADRAIRLLGLLIEREKSSHSADHDAALAELLGPEPMPRMTPLAVHEAVDLLITHLAHARVPVPGVVWALTRSRDPRIAPHLVALLGLVLEDPAHQAVASQVVSGLTSFRDVRTVAALRLAAERGDGDAREQAVSWLRIHDAEAAQVETAKLHAAPSSSFSLSSDVYRLQRRPGSTQYAVNDGSNGLIVFDAATGTEITRVAFSPGFPRERPVRQWCFSADGSQAAVFADSGAGCLVSLISGASTDLAAPLDGDVDDLRYLWDDRLIIAAGEVAILFGLSLTGGVATFDKLRSLEVRRDHRGWMRCVDAVKPLTSRVLRTEPHEHRILAYDFASSPEFVVLGPAADSELRVPASQFVRTTAYTPGHLFLLHDHEVQVLDARGAITDRFPAPEGTYFRALDIVGDVLVVVSGLLDESKASALFNYDLSHLADSSAPCLSHL